MKNLLLTSIIIITILPVWGQSPQQDSALRIGLMGIEYHSTARRYSNNQYFEQWAKGTLYLKSGEVIPQVLLRYDKYVDEVLWLRETDFKTAVISHEDVEKFELPALSPQKTIEFIAKRIKLPYRNDSIDVFLQLLVKGPIELYAYRKVKEVSNYSLVDDTYYLLFKDGKSHFTGLSKHLVARVPFFDEIRVKSVLKSNKIRLNGSEEALVMFVEKYNK